MCVPDQLDITWSVENGTPARVSTFSSQDAELVHCEARATDNASAVAQVNSSFDDEFD